MMYHIKRKQASEMNNQEVEKMYLDYVNNFISVQAFADHYRISRGIANYIINKGREINNS